MWQATDLPHSSASLNFQLRTRRLNVVMHSRRDSRRRSRSRDRHSSRKDRDRSESPPPRRKRERKTGFDVLPPGGVIPGVGTLPGMTAPVAVAAAAATGFSTAPTGCADTLYLLLLATVLASQQHFAATVRGCLPSMSACMVLPTAAHPTLYSVCEQEYPSSWQVADPSINTFLVCLSRCHAACQDPAQHLVIACTASLTVFFY